MPYALRLVPSLDCGKTLTKGHATVNFHADSFFVKRQLGKIFSLPVPNSRNSMDRRGVAYAYIYIYIHMVPPSYLPFSGGC